MTHEAKDAQIIELIATARRLEIEVARRDSKIKLMEATNTALLARVRFLQGAETDTISEAMDRDAEPRP